MRDLQRLEKLSSTTALGLWAEDVILALDRVTRLGQRSAEDVEVLRRAAAILDAALGQSEQPLGHPDPANGLAATDMALGVAEDLSEERSPKGTQATLRDTAEILRNAATGELGESAEKVSAAMDFFDAVGRHQLAAGNSISGHSRGSRSWMATPTTFSYS